MTRRPKGAPAPTVLHLDFIRASEEEAETQSNEQRKQLQAMAAAQAEREMALQEREEAQRRRAAMVRIRNIALVAVSVLSVVAGLLGSRAEQQRAMADEQRRKADEIMANAMDIIVNASSRDNKNMLRTLDLFQEDAARGDTVAMDFLGAFYLGGLGIPQNYPIAAMYFAKAAEESVPAMVVLGELHLSGMGGLQKDNQRAIAFKMAAAKGSARAMVKLGLLYLDGRGGLTKDDAMARGWFEKAAAEGSATAKRYLLNLPIQ